MASLGTLIVNGNGNGPRNWATQDYTLIDESVGSGTDAILGQNSSTGTPPIDQSDTSFTLSDPPTDCARVDTLGWKFRYRVNGRDVSGSDTFGLECRIVSYTGGTTILAAADSGGAFTVVDGNINQTGNNPSWLEAGGPTAFAYVNTSAAPNLWRTAEVEIRQRWTISGTNDAGRVEVESLEFRGTYTQSALTTSGTGSGTLRPTLSGLTSSACAAATGKMAVRGALASTAAAATAAPMPVRGALASAAAAATVAPMPGQAALTSAGAADADLGPGVALTSAAAADVVPLSAQAVLASAGAAQAAIAYSAGGTAQSTEAIATARLVASSQAQSAAVATAEAHPGASLTAAAEATADIARTSFLDSLDAQATCSLIATRAECRSTGSAAGAGLTGGGRSQSDAAATAQLTSGAAARCTDSVLTTRLLASPTAKSECSSSAALVSGVVSCHGQATASLLGTAALLAVGGASTARLVSSATLQSAPASTGNLRPSATLRTDGLSAALIRPQARLTSAAFATVEGHATIGDDGFITYGVTNSTPGAPIGTLEYKLDKSNYAYALSSLSWNTYQYLVGGAGRMTLRIVDQDGEVQVASDAFDTRDFATEDPYEVVTATRGGLVGRWWRSIIGRHMLPQTHANALSVHWVAEQEETTAAEPATGIPGIPSGESEAPHARFEVPDLLLNAELGDLMYLFDAENEVATPRSGLIDDLPVIGGPILSKLDASRAIGVFIDHSKWHVGAYGVEKRQVKWQTGANTALSLLWTQIEGIPSEKGTKYGDFWLVVGTLTEVEDTFLAIRDTLAAAKQQVSRVQCESAASLEAIGL